MNWMETTDKLKENIFKSAFVTSETILDKT